MNEEILLGYHATDIKNIESIINDGFVESKFDIICAVYPKNISKIKTNLPGDFISCVQKQICVKNPRAIKKVEELQYSQVTKGIFNLIKKNRGEKND